MPADDLALVDYARLTPDSLRESAEAAMRACDAAVDAIVAIPDGERTFANTMVALEAATDDVQLCFRELRVHGVRLGRRRASRHRAREVEKRSTSTASRFASARTCTGHPRVRGNGGGGALDRRGSAAAGAQLRDYRRSGFELPPEQRQRVQALIEPAGGAGCEVPEGDRRVGRRDRGPARAS